MNSSIPEKLDLVRGSTLLYTLRLITLSLTLSEWTDTLANVTYGLACKRFNSAYFMLDIIMTEFVFDNNVGFFLRVILAFLNTHSIDMEVYLECSIVRNEYTHCTFSTAAIIIFYLKECKRIYFEHEMQVTYTWPAEGICCLHVYVHSTLHITLWICKTFKGEAGGGGGGMGFVSSLHDFALAPCACGLMKAKTPIWAVIIVIGGCITFKLLSLMYNNIVM